MFYEVSSLFQVTLYLYKSTIRSGAPSCYLDILDMLERQLCGTVDSSLAVSLGPLNHRQNVVSLSFIRRSYFSWWSSELTKLIPFLYSRGRSTRYSNTFHNFFVTIPRSYKDARVDIFLYRTARLSNFLLAECIPLIYDLDDFKSTISDKTFRDFFTF